jgi:hypothetical protein
MFLIWNQFHPLVIVFFVVGLIFAEIFIKIRWRLSANCPYCGFDPILYKIDSEKACQKVIKRLENLRLSGEHLLVTKNPLAKLSKRPSEKSLSNLPIKSLTPQNSKKKKGQLLQREI